MVRWVVGVAGLRLRDDFGPAEFHHSVEYGVEVIDERWELF